MQLPCGAGPQVPLRHRRVLPFNRGKSRVDFAFRQQAGQCLALLFRRKLQCREQIVWRHGDHRPVRIVLFRTILVRPVPQHRG